MSIVLHRLTLALARSAHACRSSSDLEGERHVVKQN